ncbi:hypothetical protein Tco_0606308 [Tanacetum coccineum]
MPSSSAGTAQATSQDLIIVGIILEELLGSILNMPSDCSAEVDLLYSLIVKAMNENNRYKKPKKQTKSDEGSNNTTIHVQPSFKIQTRVFSLKGTQTWMPIEEERLETVTTPNRWLTKKKTNLSREEHYQGAIRTSFCSKIPTRFVEEG